MFRAAHRSPSRALNCICSLWFICPYGDRPLPRLSGHSGEPLKNIGIMTYITKLHLVGISTEFHSSFLYSYISYICSDNQHFSLAYSYSSTYILSCRCIIPCYFRPPVVTSFFVRFLLSFYLISMSTYHLLSLMQVMFR